MNKLPVIIVFACAILPNTGLFAQDSGKGAASHIITLGLGLEMNTTGNLSGGAVFGFDYCFPNAPLAIGFNAAGSSNFSGDNFVELYGAFRWYFLNQGHDGPFLQAGMGGIFDFSCDEKPFSAAGELRSGYRLPLGKNWYIEQFGRAGYPSPVSRLATLGLGVMGGIRLPLLKEETKVKTEAKAEVKRERAKPAPEEKKPEEPPQEMPAEEAAAEEVATGEALAANIAARFEEFGGGDTTIEITEDGIKISLQKMQFLPNSAALHESELWKVQEAARFLRSIPNVKILITGHTARAGTAEMSKRVSQDRADYVANYLVDLGVVQKANVTTIGYGHERPIADNNTLEGMATNRRIEIIILDN